jgi:NAD(P)-dependent dehydrogenase (short-subunit alcohol dehydrogenase family)
MRLKNRIALVTGASKGIGRDIAIGFAREGAHVVINYHTDQNGAEETAERVQALGRRAFVHRADVSQAEAVSSMVAAALDNFGRIDILVNNAGIAIWKPFLEITEDIWDRTLEVNLKSVFLCSQLVARDMVRRGEGGTIVNISSIAAHAALDCLVPYCASKGGMTLATKAIAVELAPYGIRVNAVAPGTIAIERNLKTDPDYPGNWEPFIPMGRVGQTEDIVKPVIFLACDESSYITGQTLFAAGGELAYVPMPRADFAR